MSPTTQKKPANTLKKGNYYIPEGETEPFLVFTNDHSKSGKHGHAKSRIGCIGLFSKKKKSLLMTADEQCDVPEILKKNGQLIDVDDNAKIVHVMDLVDYQTYEVDYPLDEEDTDNLNKLADLKANPDTIGEAQIEYWDVMNKKFVTRVMINK